MDEPLVTEACGVVSDAENMDPWDLPHVITITGMLLAFVFANRLYILKLFIVVLPVGYCEVIFLCMYG